MSSDSSTLSKTERNLWNAIISEALAYLKYNAYAHKALEEGLPEVAQVFQEVAGAETIHGLNHLRVRRYQVNSRKSAYRNYRGSQGIQHRLPTHDSGRLGRGTRRGS